MEEATRVAERLQTLERIGAAAKESMLPAVQFHVQREIRSINKVSRSAEGKTAASALLKRFLRKRREEEERSFRASRAENLQRAKERARIKDAAKKLRVAKELAAAAAKERKEALAKLPTEFSDAMLGQGHAAGGTRAHCAQREACLERLRLRAPPLSRELRVVWGDFKKEYAKWMGVVHKEAVGIRMLEVVRDTMTALGDHLLPADGGEPLSSSGVALSSSGADLAGDPGAFEKFVKRARKRLPRPASSLVV